MVKLSSTKVNVTLSGLALLLTAGTGVASAEPAGDPLVNTTCSYGQVVAALTAERPDLAAEFQQEPMAQAMLTSFLAAPLNQRQQMVARIQATPMGQQYMGGITQIANSCSKY
ncbi:hemophore-related protein [Mycolicibacterium stellerae]|uniref:hemophore-related protein n=1 Tax=Mycolicibacterium stellerae TaxID=2358193 RepID=UPI000F0B259C|nr:hemophore-related protein [Mycolicibacterium stellerae]